MVRLPISLSIIAFNEEANLRRCIASAADLVSEVVVVDSGSTDQTLSIAREFGARVQHQDWLGHRDQKNVALGLCTQPWVLALDADEELSKELRASIETFFASDMPLNQDGAEMNRCTHFLGRWIRHGDWYPDRKLRLFKRDLATWGGSPEHDYIELRSKRVQHLSGDLLHYSFRDMRHYLAKQTDFSDVFLTRERDAGKRFSVFAAITRPLWRFFRAYVLRLGLLDGFAGLWIAVATAFFAFVRHSRRYEDRTP